MIALLLLAAPDLAALRAHAADFEQEATRARAVAQEIATRREAAEVELAARKKSVDEGHGGWFGERRVRAQSAIVRDLAEDSISAERALADAEARAAAARAELRDALFLAASTTSAAADAEARAGRIDEAQGGYRSAASNLAEAARLAAAKDDAEPWRGLDAEIPVDGAATPAERAAVAAAYRRAAELVSTRLERLRSRLVALEPAAAAWARLSRFRGVLDRAGATAADPTPERDRVATQIAAGGVLEAKLRARAAALEAAR